MAGYRERTSRRRGFLARAVWLRHPPLSLEIKNADPGTVDARIHPQN